MDKIRVLVVDDHPLVRSGLCMAINLDPNMQVAGEARDGLEGVEQARALKPDVIVMDLAMPRLDGVEAIIQIRQSEPDARILVLTSFAEDEKIIAAIRAGAMGYLLKDQPSETVIQAIRDVAQGESVIQPRIARRLMQEIRAEPHEAPDEALTKREREILGWVARGLPNKEIARKVNISEATVRAHVSSIFSKLDVTNRSQVVLYAVQKGLVDFDKDE